MICHKCGSGYMVDDSYRDIEVLRCWLCGERIYPGHPKRSGLLVCSRCGDELDEANPAGLCTNCSRDHGMDTEWLKERSYGETVCICGATFIRKSPRQHFHSPACRKRTGRTATL